MPSWSVSLPKDERLYTFPETEMLDGKTLLDFSVVKAEGVLQDNTGCWEEREQTHRQAMEEEVLICRLQRMQSQTATLSLVQRWFTWIQVKGCTERTQQAEGYDVVLNTSPSLSIFLVLIKCLLISKVWLLNHKTLKNYIFLEKHCRQRSASRP